MAIDEVLTPVVQNVTMTLADTEYSLELPANTKYFSIQCQDGTAFRMAFVTGKVATPTAPFLTIRANNAYNSPEKIAVANGARTIYFGCGSAAKVIELISYTHVISGG